MRAWRSSPRNAIAWWRPTPCWRRPVRFRRKSCQIIFTTPRHDPQAVADRRFSEAVSFAVVARIIIPTSEVAGLTELLNRQAAAEREANARMANPPEGAVTPSDKPH